MLLESPYKVKHLVCLLAVSLTPIIQVVAAVIGLIIFVVCFWLFVGEFLQTTRFNEVWNKVLIRGLYGPWGSEK